MKMRFLLLFSLLIFFSCTSVKFTVKKGPQVDLAANLIENENSTADSYQEDSVETDNTNNASGNDSPAVVTRDVTEVQQQLSQTARQLVGAKTLNINGEKFTMDCSGLTLAIYYNSGVDLRKIYPKYTGNGVSRLFQGLEDQGLLSQEPSPGDLIFWDDTWDKNGDGKWNDPLTHVGMVVAVYDNGDIDYVHEHVTKGITIEKMNLKMPDSREHNAGMRMRVAGEPYPPPQGWLASHLFKSFGKAYLLKL